MNCSPDLHFSFFYNKSYRSVRLMVLLFGLLMITESLQAAAVRFRCMWRDDPATTMVIGWDQVTGANPTLYYDITDYGQQANQYKMSKKPDRIINARGMNNHFVRLTGLQANTVYYFVIRDSEGSTRRMSFKTAPDKPTERLSVIAGGDSRKLREARRSANKLVAKLRPHVVLFNGDMTADDSASEWKKWFDDWQETIGSDGRLFPIVIARGNHEASNQSLLDLFDAPNPGLVYALTLGGNLLRVYTLNTMIPASGEQRDWLENDLKNSSDVVWRFAQYHHAMRPHTRNKPEKDELVQHWAPLFFKYKVQLIIESDSHVMKWTWPIRPSMEPGSDEGFIRDDTNGSVYIGEGCWGAPLRAADDDKKWTRTSGSFNNFSWIFVDQEKIEVRTVLTDVSDNVAEVNDRNLFLTPVGLSIWSPPTGDVLEIFKKPQRIIAAKTEPAAPPIETPKPNTNQATSEKEEDKLPLLKVQCDASGKAAVRYTIEQAGEVALLLLDEAYKILDRQNLSRQPAKVHLREIDLGAYKSGNYYVIIRCNNQVIAKYQIIR